MFTDFNPSTWNGNGHSADLPGGANGDGSFTYPGEGGKPVGTIRLSNIADGIEGGGGARAHAAARTSCLPLTGLSSVRLAPLQTGSSSIASERRTRASRAPPTSSRS